MSRAEAGWFLFSCFSLIGIGLGVLAGPAIKDTSTKPEWYRAKLWWGVGFLAAGFSCFLILTAIYGYLDVDVEGDVGVPERMIAVAPATISMLAGVAVLIWAIIDKSQYAKDELAIERTLRVEEARRNDQSEAARAHELKKLEKEYDHKLAEQGIELKALASKQEVARFKILYDTIQTNITALVNANEALKKDPSLKEIAKELAEFYTVLRKRAKEADIDLDDADVLSNIEDVGLARYKKRLGL